MHGTIRGSESIHELDPEEVRRVPSGFRPLARPSRRCGAHPPPHVRSTRESQKPASESAGTQRQEILTAKCRHRVMYTGATV